MKQTKQTVFALCIALSLFSMAAVAIVRAIPDPSEGTLEDSRTVTDNYWHNWYLTAKVTGHWNWCPPLHRCVFDEGTYDGIRYAGLNCRVDGYLTIWYGHDGTNSIDQVYQPALTVEDVAGGTFYHLYIQAQSEFMSIIPPLWWTATTAWAEVSI